MAGSNPADRARDFVRRVRAKNLHKWMGGYARHLFDQAARGARPASSGGPRHLLFALCDHYEPLVGQPPIAVGVERVAAWESGYPRLAAPFRDADGHPPRHSFFFPGEDYRPEFLEPLARLAAAGFGEVELHLHHDGDTADSLRGQIQTALRQFAEHGHLSRDPGNGRARYAFIHGNWALANSRADGRWCGVDEEVELLFETGCYADFTFPAAPSECQPNRINQIYWPIGDLRRARCYERGERARVGVVRRDRLLMIQGPLSLARRPQSWSVRIENSDLHGGDPPSATRVATWVAQDIHIAGRPEWVFVKAHTHGAREDTAASLLGDGGRALHEALTGQYNDGERWVLHYVTAREMYNIARAALDGKSGDPGQYRNYALPPPPVAARA